MIAFPNERTRSSRPVGGEIGFFQTRGRDDLVQGMGDGETFSNEIMRWSCQGRGVDAIYFPNERTR